MDINNILLIYVIAAIICGFITMAIAHHNERSKFIAFIAGFFMGTLGIAVYAIMGETIELRVALEEKERRKYVRKTESKS